MKIWFDGSVMLVRPEGRIDSENASAVEEEIFSIFLGEKRCSETHRY